METKKIKENGYNLIINNTDKFKTIRVTLNLRTKFNVADIPYRVMIPSMIRSGNNTYKTRKSIVEELDILYGATINSTVSRLGENSILSINMVIVNPKYVSDKNLLNKSLALFNSIIKDYDNFDQKKLDEEVRIHVNELKSEYDNKDSFAYSRLKEHMFENEEYKYKLSGKIDDFKNINADKLFKYYKECLDTNEATIIVSGDIDEKQIRECLNKYFVFNEVNIDANYVDIQDKKVTKVNTIVETQDIQQAKLFIGLRTNTRINNKSHYAMSLLNLILGGISNSLLFTKVREENNLAYSVYSVYEGHKGFLVLAAGVDKDKVQETIDLMLKQLEVIKNNEYSEELFESSKKKIQASINQVKDSQSALDSYHYLYHLRNKEVNLEKILTSYNSVTRNEISEVAHNIILDTVYLLTNKEVTLCL